MTKKHELKTLIFIALPLMAAFLAQRGMQFIDTLMMGWIGPTALAAGAIGTGFFLTILLFCSGALSAIGIFVVRAKGADNAAEIKSLLQHGFYLALLLCIPCILVIWFVPQILLILGEAPDVIADVRLLLHGLVWGFPGFLFFIVLREFISAFSLTLVVMIVALFSIPLTFAANYVLIYGKYHFPQLGIAGIGYGGAIVMWFMFLGLLIYGKSHSLLKEHLNWKTWRIENRKIKDLLSVGLPSGGLFLLDAGMFLMSALLMGYFGVASLAAYQIALQCVNVAYTLPIALSTATALRVGQAAGAKDFTAVKHTALLSFGVILLFAALFALVFISAADFLANLFLQKGEDNFQETHQLATRFLHIAALFLCFDGLQAVVNGALRGLRDTFIPMILTLGCYWVLGVGGAYYLSMHTALAASGIWYGLTLALCSAAVILMLRFFRKLSQRT